MHGANGYRRIPLSVHGDSSSCADHNISGIIALLTAGGMHQIWVGLLVSVKRAAGLGETRKNSRGTMMEGITGSFEGIRVLGTQLSFIFCAPNSHLHNG